MRIFRFLAIFIFAAGCVTLAENKKIAWQEFANLTIGIDTAESVIQELGAPSEIRTSEEDKTFIQWVYYEHKTPKLSLSFNNDRLVIISQSIWETEEESDLRKLLSKFSGNWKVIPEPVTNPHAMPSMCNLVDDATGKSIEIHGYSRRAEQIVKWDPKTIKSQAEPLEYPEYCIAGFCSRITNPNSWKPRHCDWLKEMIKR